MSFYFWKSPIEDDFLDVGDHKEWTRYYGPFLEEEENVVEFQIKKFKMHYNFWGLVIGIIDPKKNTKKQCLGISEFGWGFISTGEKKHNTPSLGQKYTEKKFKEGDRVTMKYIRSEGKISYELNGKDLGVAFSNVRGERLQVCVSSNCTKLIIKGTIPDISDPDESDRMDFVLNEMSNVEIPLKNRNLSLWDSLLVLNPFILERMKSRKVKVTEIPNRLEIKELSSLSLDVDEEIIIRFLTGSRLLFSGDRKNEIIHLTQNQLMNYFVFFKTLGLIDEMYQVLIKLWIPSTTSKCSFVDVSETFTFFVSNFENKETRDLLQITKSKKTQNLVVSFSHSFSKVLLLVMNRMKKKYTGQMGYDWERKVPEIVQTLVDGVILPEDDGKILSFKFLKVFHSDFKNYEKLPSLDDATTLQKHRFYEIGLRRKLQYLYKNRKETGDLKLTTSDGGVVTVHCAVMIFKMNFFHRMMSFGGMEKETMEEKGEISIVDIGKRELEKLVEILYTDEMKGCDVDIDGVGVRGVSKAFLKDLKTLILVYVHVEKFIEVGLMYRVFRLIWKLEEKYSVLTGELCVSDTMRECLKQIGYLIGMNENVSKKLLPVFTKFIKKREVEKLIQRSMKKMKKK